MRHARSIAGGMIAVAALAGLMALLRAPSIVAARSCFTLAAATCLLIGIAATVSTGRARAARGSFALVGLAYLTFTLGFSNRGAAPQGSRHAGPRLMTVPLIECLDQAVRGKSPGAGMFFSSGATSFFRVDPFSYWLTPAPINPTASVSTATHLTGATLVILHSVLTISLGGLAAWGSTQLSRPVAPRPSAELTSNAAQTPRPFLDRSAASRSPESSVSNFTEDR